MALPEIVDRDQWKAARIALLAEEKAMTHARDALSTKRREMPIGARRQGAPVRRPGRFGAVHRPVRGTAPADRAALHVRPQLGGRLLELHRCLRRALRRFAAAPARARHDPVEFNFRSAPELAAKGWDWMLDGSTEQPGYSIFLSVDGQTFHTNSVFARGTEWLGGSYAFLDLTALGRQEDWERPEGRADMVRGAVPNFSS